MKINLLVVLLFMSLYSVSQKTAVATDSFVVEGTVKETRSFNLRDLAGLPVIAIDSLVITNHLKERKHAIKNIKGALLKDVLSRIIIDQQNVKLLSEYYFVCVAADNYKVVFSWNEIFNNETGRHVLIITEADGKTGTSMDDRIALLSPTDEATGRRYVKGLQKILIERVK